MVTAHRHMLQHPASLSGSLPTAPECGSCAARALRSACLGAGGGPDRVMTTGYGGKSLWVVPMWTHLASRNSLLRPRKRTFSEASVKALGLRPTLRAARAAGSSASCPAAICLARTRKGVPARSLYGPDMQPTARCGCAYAARTEPAGLDRHYTHAVTPAVGLPGRPFGLAGWPGVERPRCSSSAVGSAQHQSGLP